MHQRLWRRITDNCPYCGHDLTFPGAKAFGGFQVCPKCERNLKSGKLAAEVKAKLDRQELLNSIYVDVDKLIAEVLDGR